MASHDFTLAAPPSDPDDSSTWLQHVGGLILVEDVMRYALDRIPEGTSPEAAAVAEQAVRNAMYGICMIADEVSGAISRGDAEVRLSMAVTLAKGDERQDEHRLELADGDGACMGFHGWLEGDFGSRPITE